MEDLKNMAGKVMTEEKILSWQKNKTYFFGDKVLWEEKERILVTGSSIGVPPSELYLLWRKYGE